MKLHTGLNIEIYVILINQFFPHCGIIVEYNKQTNKQNNIHCAAAAAAAKSL